MDYSCYGCTDAEACNYDETATVDDDSCDYSCYGCTDPEAATTRDGHGRRRFVRLQLLWLHSTLRRATTTRRPRLTTVLVTYSCYGCTDAEACNYDETATVDDGTCDYSCCYGLY